MSRFSPLLGTFFALSVTAFVAASGSVQITEAEVRSTISITVTDGRDVIVPGSSVIYAVTLRQDASTSFDTSAQVVLPSWIQNTSASNGGTVNGNIVQWNGITLLPSIPVTMTVQGTLNPSAPQGTILSTLAQAGSSSNTDTSTVSDGTTPIDSNFQVLITDDRATAMPSEVLTYTITVRNRLSTPRTTNVAVVLPDRSIIETCSGTPEIETPNVRWIAQTFSGSSSRTFTCRAMVEQRATRYIVLRSSVNVSGAQAFDSTSVIPYTSQRSSRRSSSSSSRRSSSSSRRRVSYYNPSTTNIRDTFPEGLPVTGAPMDLFALSFAGIAIATTTAVHSAMRRRRMGK